MTTLILWSPWLRHNFHSASIGHFWKDDLQVHVEKMEDGYQKGSRELVLSSLVSIKECRIILKRPSNYTLSATLEVSLIRGWKDGLAFKSFQTKDPNLVPCTHNRWFTANGESISWGFDTLLWPPKLAPFTCT